MNPEEQFIADLKTGLGDNYSVNVNSYDMTEFFKKNSVGPDFKPEDIFTIDQLDKWARDNGYVKFY